MPMYYYFYLQTRRLLLSVLLGWCYCQFGFAQNTPIPTSDIGTWHVLNFKMGIYPKWDIIVETQMRSLSFYNNFNYYEYKGGANYSVNKYFSAFFGAGNYNSFQETGTFISPQTNNEFRIWQQLTMSQLVGRVKFEHRYRVEQRWLTAGYRNRFRYRINTVIPLNDKTIQPKTLYTMIANEVFLTNQPPYFEQNRVFVGLGYELSNPLTLQVGWLNQFVYRGTTESSKNYFQLAILIDVELHNKQANFTPSLID